MAPKTSPKPTKSFQESLQRSRADGQLLVDMAGNAATGIHGATAATIYKLAREATEDQAKRLANKIAPGAGTAIEFVLDTGVTVIFNEGLEAIRVRSFLLISPKMPASPLSATQQRLLWWAFLA